MPEKLRGNRDDLVKTSAFINQFAAPGTSYDVTDNMFFVYL